MITFLKEQVIVDNDDYDNENQASSNRKSSPVEVSRVPLGGRLAEIMEQYQGLDISL